MPRTTSRRLLALVLACACALALGACGSDGDDSSSDDTTTETTADGGADTTVSTEDYVSAVDAACKTAVEANAAFTPPTFADPNAPTSSEFAEYVNYLDSTMPASETFIETIDDMPQPSDSADAEKADALTDAFGRALEAQREMRTAAAGEDVAALGAATEDFNAATADYTALLNELGITGCG